MIKVDVINRREFVVRAQCGEAWKGRRHTIDTKIMIDLALDHTERCAECAQDRGESIERDR